jgi:beta-lactamase regulating signal transducer with metallopeptidase domain
VHTLVNLSSIFGIIYVTGLFAFRLLHGFKNWSLRRLMQLLILMLPLASLIVLTGTAMHVTLLQCIVSAPLWDHILDLLLFLLMCCLWMETLLFGSARLLLMKRLMQRKESIVDPALQVRVDTWARHRGISSVRIRLTHSTRPIALLYGIRKPTILLSTWMVHHLDAPELEAVVAHELEHVSRRDYLINWYALMLRDAFFYLPTSRMAYRQFSQEKELACDDEVVLTTQRPLALASALTKVWLHLVEHPQASQAPLTQALVGSGEQITHRVDRLLTIQSGATSREPFSLRTRLFIGGLASLVVITSIVLMLIEIGCWPSFLTFHLF